MTTWVTRDEWGALAPRSVSHNVTPTEGVAVHHVGGSSFAFDPSAAPGPFDPCSLPDAFLQAVPDLAPALLGDVPLDSIAHDKCVALVRAIQGWHMSNTSEGYVDIAYNLLACHHDYNFEGRSKAVDPKVRPGSNGSTYANTVALSVCCLWGDADGTPNQGIINSAASAVAWLRKHAESAPRVSGHRDWTTTSCPGHLYPKLGDIRVAADRIAAAERPDRNEPRPPVPTAPPTEPVPALEANVLITETVPERTTHWLVLPGARPVLLNISQADAESWTGPRLTVSNSVTWDRLVRAADVAR